MTPPVVYSVTVEPGSKLGGITQAPDPKAKAEMAPPKNVSTPEKNVVPEKNDAEVSLSETKVVKPTPKATTKPTAVPTKAPPPKATPAPVKKEAVDPNKEYQKAMQRYLGESAQAGGKGFGAAAVGGKGMGGGKLTSPELLAYQGVLQTHIKRGWTWPDMRLRVTTKVYFKIAESGALSEIKVVQSSGVAEFDDSVLRALAKANPVPRPPEKVYEAVREVWMTFDPRDQFSVGQ